MNTKITALKKKIDLKEKQLEKKENLAARSKEAAKDLKHELELLKNELAQEEMREMLELLSEKNLVLDDVKAAIASGAIEPVKTEETAEPEKAGDENIIEKEEETKISENENSGNKEKEAVSYA